VHAVIAVRIIQLSVGVAAHAKQLPQDARWLGWVGDHLPVGERHRGAEDAAYLSHEGGTTEHASTVPSQEPTQRGHVVSSGIANDAGGGGVHDACFVSEWHRSVMLRSRRASSQGARRTIADG
jgi:hypothetical protein